MDSQVSSAPSTGQTRYHLFMVYMIHQKYQKYLILNLKFKCARYWPDKLPPPFLIYLMNNLGAVKNTFQVGDCRRFGDLEVQLFDCAEVKNLSSLLLLRGKISQLFRFCGGEKSFYRTLLRCKISQFLRGVLICRQHFRLGIC